MSDASNSQDERGSEYETEMPGPPISKCLNRQPGVIHPFNRYGMFTVTGPPLDQSKIYLWDMILNLKIVVDFDPAVPERDIKMFEDSYVVPMLYRMNDQGTWVNVEDETLDKVSMKPNIERNVGVYACEIKPDLHIFSPEGDHKYVLWLIYKDQDGQEQEMSFETWVFKV